MPRVGSKAAVSEPAMPAAKKVKAKQAPAARKMPAHLPGGMMLTDFTKKVNWVLGVSIGKGGFGEIYTASRMGPQSTSKEREYVIKIEPHDNGPLFTELSFYRRIAKPSINWKTSHHLSYLAVPEFVAAGDHTHSGVKYRFMVMHRYGQDIEKHFVACQRIFQMKTICYLALRVLEALEFLHESDYVHADVKGSNLLTGFGAGHQHEVYLVDYGLAYRYRPDGVHKDYIEDPRRKHDGTIEFTSIDAHSGANPSRRSDLEVLGYCLLQWASGRLPWEGRLEDKDYVFREKKRYKGDIRGLMSACFHGNPQPSCLYEYMKSVHRLDYKHLPDYTRLKQLFLRELKDLGLKDDPKQLDWLDKSAARKRNLDDSGESQPKKQRKSDAPVKKPPKEQPLKKPVEKAKHVPVPSKHKMPANDYDIGKVPHVMYPPELGYTNGDKKVARGSKRTKDPRDDEEHFDPDKDYKVKRKATGEGVTGTQSTSSDCVSSRTRSRTK